MNSFIGDESIDIIPASPDGKIGKDSSKDPQLLQQRHFSTFQHRSLNPHKAYGYSDKKISIPDSDEELDNSEQRSPLNNDVESNVVNCSDDSIIDTSHNGLTNSYLNESFQPLKEPANLFNPMFATSSTPTLSKSWRDTTKLDSSLEEDDESFVISPQRRINLKDDSDESDPDESPIKRNYFKVARNRVDSLILTPENKNEFDNISVNSSDKKKVCHNLDDSEITEKKDSRRTARVIYSDEEHEDHVSLSLTENTKLSKSVNVPYESPSKLYKGKYKIKKKSMSTSVTAESDNSFIDNKSSNMSILSNKMIDCSPSRNKSMNISTSSVTSLDISAMSQAEVEEALKRNKKLLKTTNLSQLPDRGMKIKDRISALEESISLLNITKENSLEDKESDISSELPSLDASDDSIYSINTSTDVSKGADDDIVEIKEETPSSRPYEESKFTKAGIEVYGNKMAHHIGTDLQVLKEELLEKQRIFRATNQRSLPDGGARLREEISSIQGKIMMAELKGANSDYGKSSNDPDVLIEKECPKYSQAPLMNNALQLSVANQATDPSKYHLPQHVLESMYDEAKDYGARDYGGKLSAARERDMVRVTAGAVEGLHRILKSMPDVEIEEEPQPDGIKVSLMPHQRRALRWLLWRENQNPPGGILADDMGLGKTLTMLSLVLKHKELIEEGKMADDVETLGERNRHNDSEWIHTKGGLKSKKKTTASRGTLVVCPASLLGQWEGEAKKRISGRKLSIHVYHGNNRDLSLSRLSQFDIVVTTYQIVMREAFNPSVTKTQKKNQDDIPEIDAQHQGRLFQIGWTRIILDESHVVRNHKSQTSQAVCMLKGGRRWAVTGTPIQNKEMDMYSIVRFLRVDPFENYTCWKHQVQNQSAHGLMKLNLLVRTLMLRRTKDQVDQVTGEVIVSLPQKEVVHHSLSLTQEERQVYDRVFAFSKSSLIEYMKSQEEKEKEKLNRNGQSSKPMQAITNDRAYEKYMPTLQCDILKTEEIKAHHMLVLLLRLRQICCHPSLIKGIIEDETKATDGLASNIEKKEDFEADLISQMNEMNLKDGLTSEEIDNRVKDEILTADNPVFKKKTISSKILEVLSEIDVIRKKDTIEKAVIVSQWSSMLEIVYKHLTKRGIKTTAITGQIPVKCRGALVDEFNNDLNGPQVMLLSLAAGGVGLNLVGANHLFLIDMHWNPQLEKQACDRIYRVGQTKPVKIHRFIVQNTVEEKILELQKKKLALADDVLSGSKRSDMSNKLTLQDMKSLFGIV